LKTVFCKKKTVWRPRHTGEIRSWMDNTFPCMREGFKDLVSECLIWQEGPLLFRNPNDQETHVTHHLLCRLSTEGTVIS
jgi:hypothetical protein